MFSRFLKYIIPPLTFRIYFRRIFYSNLKKVPLDKPLLFAGNHQNSFMDGILVGSYLPQPLHFLMRADMFKRPFARFCLKELNVAPVYRIEEGFENVHKNNDTFREINEVLRKNGNFVVFSEGICVQEKRLQKLRKGTEGEHGLDVHIVPVGINYTYPSKFRKEVMINFHDPFSIKELKEIYSNNPAKGLLAFNQKVEASLREEVIIIEDPGHDRLAEHLLSMGRNDMILPFFRWRFDTDERRQLEKSISEKINYAGRNEPQKLEIIAEKVKDYSDLLEKHRLIDENVARKLDFGFLRYFFVIAGLPFFIAGYLGNVIPFIGPRIICDLLIKDKRFYSSVFIASGTILYIFYFPLLLVLAVIFAGWTGLLTGLLMPFAGYLSLFYMEVARERFYTFRYWWKSLTERPLVGEIKKRRQEIQTVTGSIFVP